ncbi:MAG TPA: DUF2911 domain-containing protein [Vicinamibacteria bacterium]|nr:DUF2911 domain-containing protein [Vicinamibacteria bacterium]
MQKRLALAALAVAVAGPALAQESSRGEAKATVAGKAVSIEYGRPSLRGRDMMAQAQIGQAWRMGSGAATSLKTEADLAFGSVAVPKGDYVLTATRISADEWHLNVLKSDRSPVAEIPLAPGKLAASVETFTVSLKGDGEKGELEMQWGTTALKAAFTGK